MLARSATAIRRPRTPLALVVAAAAAGTMTGLLLKLIGFLIAAGFMLWSESR